MKSIGKPGFAKRCAVAFMLLLYSDSYVLAAPRGGHVVSGTASFTQDGNLTVITAGNRAIINYQSFNIGSNEIVRFVQPSASSTVLNRVLGIDPTNIFGQLQANGIVVIVNPYGVYFRNGSVLSLGGLYAGAGQIANADFAAGNIHFTDLTGDVRNDGVVAATNQIALMGANVVNAGTLTSAHGTAVLASGPDVYVGTRDGNIFVQANGKAVGSAATDHITNRGTVAAPRILLGAGDLYSTAIVNSGLLQGRNIAVDAGRHGTAKIGGRLDASAARTSPSTGVGGSIEVLGGRVALQGATLDASGAKGGGSVRVGGDRHGSGKMLQAATTSVDAKTTIDADATGANGNGGSVVLWSDVGTLYSGAIMARAGSAGGNGGAVEVSSHGLLGFYGHVNADAAAGKPGSLLLDPLNIEIVAGDGAGTTTTGDAILTPTGTIGVADTTGSNSFLISQDALQGLAGGTNIHLEATHDIRIDALTGGVLTLATGAGTVQFDANAGTTLPGGTATYGSFVMASQTDTIMASGRNVTITAGAPGGTAQGGINPEPFSILAGNINTSNSSGAGGNVALSVGTTLTGLHSSDVQAGTITTTGGDGAGGSVTVNALTSYTNTSGQAYTFSGALPSSVSLGAISAGGSTTGGAIVVGAQTSGTGPTMAPGTISLTGAITGGSLTINNATSTTTLGGNVTTTAGQIYNGAVLLSQTSTTLSDDSAAGMTFAKTVDGVTAGANALTLSGSNVTFDGAVGGLAALKSLATTGTATAAINGGSVVTSGTAGQSYDDTVTLGPAGLLTTLSAGTAPIIFEATVTGAAGTSQGLTLSTTGLSGFGGPAGTAARPLGSLATIGGGEVTIDNGVTTAGVGGQSYSGTVELGGAMPGATITLTANGGGGILFASGVGGNPINAAGSTSLSLITAGTTRGAITFDGAVGTTTGPAAVALDALTTSAGTTVNINGGAVTTDGGGQSYGGPVVLGAATATTLSDSGSGAISFGDTINGSSAMGVPAQALTVATSGAITFGGAVGSTAVPLASLANTGTGTVEIDGGSITTSGNQTYPTAVTLGQATTLTGSTLILGAGVTVDGAGSTGANSNGATSNSLTLDFSTAVSVTGGTTAGGTSGTFDNIDDFVSKGSGGTVLAGNFETVHSQTYVTPVTLGTGVTLTSDNSGNIRFEGTLDGTTAGGQALAVNTAGTTEFDGAVGGTALASLATTGTGPVQINGGAITTSGDQTYGGAVSLGQTATLTGNALSLGAGVTVDGAGLYGLTLDFSTAIAVTGGTTAGGTSGTFNNIYDFTSEGSGGTTLAGNFETVHSQTYATDVTLSANATLKSDNSGAIRFAGLVGGTAAGGQGLTVNTGGTTEFDEAVGRVALPLASLATTGAGGVAVKGGTITTDGTLGQSFRGPVSLGTTTTLTDLGTGPITFQGSIGGSTAGGQALTLTTPGTVTFGGAVGSMMIPLRSVATTSTGEVDIKGGGVVTSGAAGQSYGGNVVVGSTAVPSLTTLTAGSGPVTFSLNVDGAAAGQGLSVGTTGQVTFAGAVGSGTALASLATTGSGPVELNGGSVATSGDQTYDGPVHLGQTTTLSGDALVLGAGGTVNGAGSLGTNSNGASSNSLTLDFSTPVAVSGGTTAGGTSGLFNNILDFTSDGANGTKLVGDFETVNTQTYATAVTLSTGVTLTSDGSGGSIIFRGTVSGTTAGGQGLTVNTEGSTEFDAAVGSTGLPLASLATTGPGDVYLYATQVFTSGALGQNYDGLARLYSAGTLTTLTAGSGPVRFGSGVNGSTIGQALSIGTTGAITFDGAVGTAVLPLGSLVTTGAGTVHLNGGSVTTNGALGQSYGGPVVLDAAGTPALTTLSAGAGPVKFVSTVAGGTAGQELSVGTTGQITFGGAVGSTATPLESLATTGTGLVELNGGSVTTSGDQTYAGAVHLGQAAVLTGDALMLGAGVTIDGAGSLGVNSNGAGSNSLTLDFSTPVAVTGGTTAGGTSGTFNNIYDFVSEGSNGTILAGNFETVHNQTYTTALTLSANAALTSDDNGAITFHTLDGTAADAQSLTVNTGGMTAFDGLVGSNFALHALTTDNEGVAGEQTQFNISLTNQPAGTVGVNIGTGGLTINDPVLFNVADNTIPARGSVSVETAGSQTYAGAATLALDSVLTNTGGGNITFGATVDGQHNLTLNTAGNEIFHGRVGGVSPLLSLTTDADPSDRGGDTIFDVAGGGTSLTTVNIAAPGGTATGGQTYNDGVLLEQATKLSSTYKGAATTGGAVDFASTVDSVGATPTNLTVLAGAGQTVIGPGATFDVAGLNLGGAQVTFAAPVGGTHPLNILTIGQNAAAGSPLGSIDINDGGFTTTLGQTYSVPVILSANTVLTDTNSHAILFQSTVDGDGVVGRSLTLTTAGTVTFQGVVGGATPLQALTVTASAGTFFDLAVASGAGVTVGAGGVDLEGPVTFDITGVGLGGLVHPAIETTGAQLYDGAVTLSQNTSLYGSGTGNIQFNGPVDGGFALILNGAGNEIFHGTVGGVTPLASLTVDGLIAPPAGGQTQFLMSPAAGAAGVRVGAGGVTIDDGVVFGAGGSTLAAPTVLTFDGGTQTYAGPASVAANTVLVGDASGSVPAGGVYSGGGAILFSSSVTGSGGANLSIFTGVGPTKFQNTVAARTLTVTGANVAFDGAVSGLGALTIAPNAGAAGGPIDLNGGTVTTGAGQTYGSAVVLGTDTALTDSGNGSITFNPNATVDGAHALTLAMGGLTIFDALVGSRTALTALTVSDAAGTTEFNMNATGATAGVLVAGPVTVNGNAIFNTAGVSLTVPSVLTLQNGAQTYGGALSLETTTVLVSAAGLPAAGAGFTGGGAFAFTSPRGIASTGGQDFYVRGGVGTDTFGSTINVRRLDLGGAAATFAGPITLPGLLSVEPDGGGSNGLLTLNGGAITTAGNQTYNAGIVLGANTVLTSLDSAGDGGNIVFTSTVDSGSQPRALTVNTPGDEVFMGIVGGHNALASLSTDAADTVGGAARFEMTVSAAEVAGVNVTGTITIHDAAIFDVLGSSLAASGPSSVSSGGAQTYAGPVTLTLATSLASANTAGDSGNILFQSTVDSGSAGARGLAVSTPGNEVFNGIVGGTAPLASLTTDVSGAPAGTARFGMDITNAPAGTAGVNVQGAVTINDAVDFDVLGSSVAAGGPVAVATGGAQNYLGAATLSAATSLASTGGGSLTFDSTVNGAQGLALSTSGAELFTGVIGGTAALTSLTATGDSLEFKIDLANAPAAPAAVSVVGPITIAAPVTFDATGSTAQQPSVLTSGSFAQTYEQAVTLLQTTVLKSGGQGKLVFNSTIDGGSALTLNSAGTTTFDSPVGAGSALLSLSLANSAGLAVLHGGSITTLEGQTFAGPVRLTAGTTLVSQNEGGLGAITFAKAVNDPNAMPGLFGLTVRTGAGTTFGGRVGNVSPLASVTTDAPGSTFLNGLSVTTTGAQTYGDAVLLGNDTTLSSSSGSITFAKTLDASGPFALELSAATSVAFDGVVGGTQPLGSIDVASSGMTILSGQVTTTGAQTYRNTVQLKLASDLISQKSGAITFKEAVNGPAGLTVDTAGSTFFDGPVGNNGSQLLDLITTGGGAAYFENGTVMTFSEQAYGGPVHLEANAHFMSSQGSVIFGQTVDGPFTLTVSSFKKTIFGGDVSQLKALTAGGNANGVTEFSGGNVQIDGPQTYYQPVELNADTDLAGSAITFKQTVDGSSTLTLAGTGDTTFTQKVTVAGITTASTGTTVFDADVVTTQDGQDYGNAATLNGGVITLTSPGTITFAKTVDGDAAGAGLVLAAPASVLGGDVGATTPLAKLDVTGTLSVGGTMVRTSGLQDYEKDVMLGPPGSATTDLTSSGGDLFFGGNVTGSGGLLAQGSRIAAQGNIMTAGNLDLETETVAGKLPGLLLLNGSNYTSNNGSVLFDTGNLSTPPVAAGYSTIVLANPGQVTIKGNGFTMGYLQKLVDLGSLTINAGKGMATIGDIAARDKLRIVAAQVGLLNRPAENPTNGVPNDALSVDAGLSIDFGGAQIKFLESANRTANFVTTTDITTIQRIQGISLFKDADLPSLFPKASDFDLPDADASLQQVANTSQPSEGGEQSLDTAAALSGALPDQKPIDVTEDITISASQMEELKKLGIHPRLAQRNERRALASKRALFAQLVDGQDMDNYGLLQPIKGGVSRLQPSDYVVVVDRMGEAEVQSILGAFEQLYGKNKEKAPEIGAAFQTAFTDYTVQKQTADPAGFSPYLQSQPGKYPAIQTAVRGFDNLFGHIEHLGLTDKEVGKSEEHIASDLGVSGVSAEDMVKVINSLRQKLPPAQKAGSNSAPASAPVGNPAPGATAPAPAKAPLPPPKTVQDYPPVNRGDVAAR